MLSNPPIRRLESGSEGGDYPLASVAQAASWIYLGTFVRLDTFVP